MFGRLELFDERSIVVVVAVVVIVADRDMIAIVVVVVVDDGSCVVGGVCSCFHCRLKGNLTVQYPGVVHLQ